MAKFYSERNLKFLLYEVSALDSLCGYARYAEHNRETFELVLAAADKLAKDLFFPSFREMDQQPPEFVQGQIKVHPQVAAIMKACGEGGWIAASAPFEHGGQQLPLMLMVACHFIFSSANFPVTAYPFLTSAATHLIMNFGSPEMKTAYLPKMFRGEWQGTMVMTEPQAGSSVSDILTSAEPTDRGYYRIKGQKIFISCGDYAGVENVIHVMLAKIKGGPPGVKGISLFVVPKKRLGENGELVSNDIQAAGIYHKLGYRGAPLTQLAIGENGDCRGFLIGEPHQGLKYMFTLMNEARLGVGMIATATASGAYYASLEYTKERLQGRPITAKDPTTPQIPIIEHADVKRMLLFQRAVVEGSLALILQCCRYADLEQVLEGEEKKRVSLLLDILTPVAKTYPSEMGIQSVSQGLQCLGGYGYCDEFPLEQYYRDARINPIHEGTTAIQGLDLLGRKVTMKNGLALKLLLEEMEKTVQAAEKFSSLKDRAAELKSSLERITDVTLHLTGLALNGEIDLFLADATLYLECFGIVCIAWQWLVQALHAEQALERRPPENETQFYTGKLHTAHYFFAYELPKIAGLIHRLKHNDGLTLKATPETFND